MKVMFAAFAAIAVIAVGANFALNNMGFSAEESTTSSSVRLGD
ncbi:hypothetical protein C8N43_3426 [Litoreibacter ponti]|uniref:Uncharacterized protein n=1 Tax=Litoreibacter ponti TaxID=1510457 RepID=A0A2T6BEY5_9RHOB|nr:hypothetical protein [Litoreibacter ponti]PTX54609.1 hypothetical protein C8N43_3426 [Litoreibacter ponti]